MSDLSAVDALMALDPDELVRRAGVVGGTPSHHVPVMVTRYCALVAGGFLSIDGGPMPAAPTMDLLEDQRHGPTSRPVSS